jgi:hypothetical protein
MELEMVGQVAKLAASIVVYLFAIVGMMCSIWFACRLLDYMKG